MYKKQDHVSSCIHIQYRRLIGVILRHVDIFLLALKELPFICSQRKAKYRKRILSLRPHLRLQYLDLKQQESPTRLNVVIRYKTFKTELLFLSFFLFYSKKPNSDKRVVFITGFLRFSFYTERIYGTTYHQIKSTVIYTITTTSKK